MKLSVVVVVLWVSMTFCSVVAGDEPDISTAQGLLDTCSVEAKLPTEYPDGVSFLADYKAENACAFYLGGYLDAHRVTSGLIETNEPLFCLPDVGISPDMVVSALAALLQQSPEYSGDPTRTVLAVALRQFFPCDTVE